MSWTISVRKTVTKKLGSKQIELTLVDIRLLYMLHRHRVNALSQGQQARPQDADS